MSEQTIDLKKRRFLTQAKLEVQFKSLPSKPSTSEQTIDLKKRRFLTQATSVVGAVGVGFVAWPFVSTWKPSARAKAAGAPVDVDISKLVAFHKQHGKDATLTSVYPPGKFGALDIQDDQVNQFTEKPKGDGALINGGFFVLSPKVFARITGDDCVWEKEPLQGLADDGNLMSFTHKGFWQPMDTLRDNLYLQKLWEEDKAPWKTW